MRDHDRAVLAHAHVQGVLEGLSDRERRAYGAHCHHLPVLVHQAGLAAALHATAALSSRPKRRLLDHLAEQVPGVDGTAKALLEASRNADLAQTLRLQREVNRCLTWYRRFAKSVLHVDAADDAGEET